MLKSKNKLGKKSAPVAEETKKNGLKKKTAEVSNEGGDKFNLSKFVKNAKDSWANAAKAAKKSSSIDLDDGRYIGRVNKMEVKEYQKKGETQHLAVWGLTVIEGKESGNVTSKLANINDEQGIEYFLRDIAKFGYDPEEIIDNLEEISADFAKTQPVVEFDVVTNKTNPDYKNIYFKKYIEDYEEEETEETEEEDEDEDEEEDKEEDEDEEDSEDEEESEDEDEGELEVGSEVEFEHEGKDLQGKVVSIDEEDEVCKVKVKSLGKTLKVPIEELTLLTADD